MQAWSLFLLLVAAVCAGTGQAFRLQPRGRPLIATPLQVENGHALAKLVLASVLLSPVCVPAAVLLQAPSPALAASSEGTKGEKKFELCVSKCIFAETRPPPIGSSVERLEAKDRSAALADCRKSCATTKEQLLTGQPKQKAAAVVEKK